MSHITPLEKIYPQSPDKYLERLGSNKSQAALARLAHLNPIIERVNLLTEMIDSTTTGITAHAGGGQANATQLSANYNEVTVVASDGDSVKLLPAQVGLRQTVKNDGAANLAVFPSSGDKIDDQSINTSVLLAPGSSLTFEAVNDTNWETTGRQVAVGSTLFVDATYGNNNTAKPYSPSYPYATIAAAVTAASAGDLILINPGAYSVSTNILKDGVNFYCNKGVSINSTGNLFNADTTAGGTTLTMPTFFLGHADLIDTNPGGGGYIQIHINPSANITLEVDSLISTNINNAMVIRDGIFNLLVRGDYTTNGRAFNFRDTGNVFAEIWGTVTTNTTSNFNGVIYSSGHSWAGMARIKAKTFSMPAPAASQAVITLDSIVNGDIIIDLDYYTDASASTYRFLTLGTGTTNCRTTINVSGTLNVSTRPLYVVADADHTLFINAPAITCTGATASAGTVHILGGTVTTTAAFTLSGANFYLNNTTVTSGATVGLTTFNVSAGIFVATSSTIVTDLTAAASVAQSGTGNVFFMSAILTVHPTGTYLGTYYISPDGNVIAGPVVYKDEQLLSGAGAVNVTNYATKVATTGADALTLADGVDGQEKFIYMTTDGGDGTLTPTSSPGYTTITFNDVGDSVLLQFSTAAGGWVIKGSFGVTIV
jgi:hypothetical protein